MSCVVLFLPPGQHLPVKMAQEPAVPCSKCGWFHRRTLEEVQAEREAVRAAKQRVRKRKQTYAVRRGNVGYRYSMFKAQAACEEWGSSFLPRRPPG